MLLKERHADGSPFWTRPGGGVPPDESLPAGLRRELREELGCEITIESRLETVWYVHESTPRTLTVYHLVDCQLRSAPDPNPAEEISDYQWTLRDALPATTLPLLRFAL